MIKGNKQIKLLVWAIYKLFSKSWIPFLETMLLP